MVWSVKGPMTFLISSVTINLKYKNLVVYATGVAQVHLVGKIITSIV